jgi:hypothetical protein
MVSPAAPTMVIARQRVYPVFEVESSNVMVTVPGSAVAKPSRLNETALMVLSAVKLSPPGGPGRNP